MADLAGNVRLVVGQFALAFGFRGDVTPGLAVAAERFGIGALRVVVRRLRINRFDCLGNLPDHVRVQARLLKELFAFPAEARAPGGDAGAEIVASAIAGSEKRGPGLDSSVAIDALDGRGRPRLTIESAVAMHVGQEMAVGALHPFGEMNVLEMNGPGELLRVVVGNEVVLQVEQVALAILLEDGAENPARSEEHTSELQSR